MDASDICLDKKRQLSSHCSGVENDYGHAPECVIKAVSSSTKKYTRLKTIRIHNGLVWKTVKCRNIVCFHCRMLAALGSSLGFIAKSGVALGLRLVIPVTWPLLRISGVATIPRIGASIPPPIQGVALFFGQPVVILMLVEAILRWKRPLTMRKFVLWRRMLPIYAAYVLKEHEIKKKRVKYDLSQDMVDALWDEHHEWGGDRVYDMVLEANGYIVKVAQIIASKPDVVPAQWISRLSKLFDAMPPRPWHDVKLVLDRELCSIGLGKTTDRLNRLQVVFDHVDEEPIAAASIAQVHCARLSGHTAQHIKGEWKSGHSVVIKVQRDVVRGLMDADLNNTERMGEFLRNVLPFEVHPIVCEMRQAIPREFDFIREARLSQAVRSRLATPEFSNLVIPRAAMELCTERMMVMEFMEGRPFSQLLYEGKNDPELLQTMRNAVTTVVKAYGHMMIYDGLFHGDPHPGNLMLSPEGQLIMLDFGQCKALPFQKQIALARLILAMDDGEALSIISALSELGINFKSLKQTSAVRVHGTQNSSILSLSRVG